MYDNETIERIRAKQDKLIALADKYGYDHSLQISAAYAGSPTISELVPYIWPNWEGVIDDAIGYMERHH